VNACKKEKKPMKEMRRGERAHSPTGDGGDPLKGLWAERHSIADGASSPAPAPLVPPCCQN